MQHGPAASSGSNPKAPGSAGGYLLTAQGFMHRPLSRTHLLRWQSGPCVFHRPYHGQSGQSGGASGGCINPRLSLMGISEWQLTHDRPPLALKIGRREQAD